jgi:hypothetical protein
MCHGLRLVTLKPKPSTEALSGEAAPGPLSGLPMSFSIRTENTRGFRWCDGIPQDPTEHQRLYFIELHGYFQASDCSGSRNEE